MTTWQISRDEYLEGNFYVQVILLDQVSYGRQHTAVSL